MPDEGAPKRYTETDPCPICGGWETNRRGDDERCHGYFSSHTKKVAFCSQVDSGLETGGVFKHRVIGDCDCGEKHDENPEAHRKTVRRRRKKARKSKVTKSKKSRKSRVVDRYIYRDPAGKPVFGVGRLEPKGFRQARIDDDGVWHSGKGCMKDVTLYPYNLPAVIAAVGAGESIWITEGEADADAVCEAGEVATTNAGGAGKWEDNYSRYLKGAEKVILWLDWDDAGRRHMADIHRSIKRASPGTEIRLVRSADDLKDARDQFNAGFTLDDVVDVDLSELGGGEAFVDEINGEYAVAAVGAATLILHERWDPGFERPTVDFLRKESFLLRFENQRIGPSSIGALWLKNPDRRTFEQVVFYPGEIDPKYYNLWRGLAVEPREGDCSLFLAHVRDNICGGDEDRFEWLVAWMADAVQHPAHRPGTAVVLRGNQGVGKGVFCQYFGSLFGGHFLQVTHSRHLVGHFNAHLKDCLILWADEAFWAGDKQNEGILRTLVTEPQLLMEPKGRDPIPMPNRVRLMMSSNNEWIVPAGTDERRFAIFDVADARKQDRDYFGRIVEEMESGGRGALLHHLLAVEYSRAAIATIPKTAALRDQKMLSLQPVEKWWFSRLEEGTVCSLDDDWRSEAPSRALHDDYVEFSKNSGQSRRATASELGGRLKRLVPGIRKLRRLSTINGSDKYRGYVYVFPSLEVCRNAFEELLGSPIEWPPEESEVEPEVPNPVAKRRAALKKRKKKKKRAKKARS